MDNSGSLVEGVRPKLSYHIDEICKSGSQIIDEKHLKEIKSICKQSDANVKICYELLDGQLEKEHSQIRYSALQIIDSIFQRSHYFRELLLDDFQDFLEQVIETNPDDYPLPPPKKAANELKKLAARTIKIWLDKFGQDYKLLELGYNYLKDCKKVDFVSFSHHTEAQRKQLEKQNEKQQLFLNKKFLEYSSQMNETQPDIQTCMDQLDRCISLLVPKFDEIFEEEAKSLASQSKASTSKSAEPSINSKLTPPVAEIPKKTGEAESSDLIGKDTDDDDDDDDSDDDDFVEVSAEDGAVNREEEDLELRYLGFLNDRNSEHVRNYNLKLDIGLVENEENQVVIEIMRDLYKELKKSHLTKINDWIKNFNAVRNSSEQLKKAIELKNSVQKILKRFENLNIIKPEVIQPKPKTPAEINDENRAKEDGEAACTSKEADESSKSTMSESEKRKMELLKIAPVINLEEIEFGKPVIQQMQIEHRFYTMKEDHSLPIEEMNAASRLTKRTFVGTFEPVKWSCRAPLRSGKLCPRMDRYKCPLHGKIVPRDKMGNINGDAAGSAASATAPSTSKAAAVEPLESGELAPWKDPVLIAEINAATGLNLQPVESKEDKEKKRGQKRKRGNLAPKDSDENTTRKRLEKRLFNSKTLQKVGSILDSIERRQHHEKFHHNFSYSINM